MRIAMIGAHAAAALALAAGVSAAPVRPPNTEPARPGASFSYRQGKAKYRRDGGKKAAPRYKGSSLAKRRTRRGGNHAA